MKSPEIVRFLFSVSGQVQRVHAVTDDLAAVGKIPPLSVVSFITAILRESL